MVKVGKISLYISPYRAELSELSELWKIPKEKIKYGLWQEKISLPYPSQDSVSLLLEVFDRALEEIDREKVGYVLVASESPADLSQSMGALLNLYFGLENYSTVEAKQACVSLLTSLVRTRVEENERALLAFTDIASYEDGAAGATQGAGAGIIELLPENEENYLLKLVGRTGSATITVPDFLKPLKDNGKLEAKKTPVFYPLLSKLAYLLLTGSAYQDFKRKNGLSLKDIDFLVMHLPYTKLAAEYGAKFLWLSDNDPEKYGELRDTISRAVRSFIEKHRSREDVEEFDRRELREVWEYVRGELKKIDAEDLRPKVMPSTVISRSSGNLYTGSWVAGLVSTLRNASYREGDNVLVVGYGSGASSVAALFEIGVNSEDVGRYIRLYNEEEKISPEKYKEWHLKFTPGMKPAKGWYVSSVCSDGTRYYSKV